MKIALNEIHENGHTLEFTEKEQWVVSALKPLHEAPDAIPPKAELEITLRLVDELILVEGRILTELGLLCSRCGEPFPFPVDARFHALYAREEGVAMLKNLEKNDSQSPFKGRAGRAFSNPGERDTDYEITYLAEDEIDLSEVIQEQIRLAVPFRPLCETHLKDDSPLPGLSATPPVATTHRPFAVLAEKLGNRKK